MINTSELRIGNYFIDTEGNTQVVYTIHETVVNESWTGPLPGGDYKLNHGYGEDDMNGMPLTPDLLKRCGWQVVDQGRGPYYWLEKQCWLHIHISEDATLYANFNMNVVPLKYLHQLQNLYFALTGEELEFRK